MALEPLLSFDARVVGKIAVEREEDVLHLRIHGVMQTFDGIRARGDVSERMVQLRERFELQRHMEFAQLARSKTQLRARDPVSLKPAVALQMIEVGACLAHEVQVVHAGLQVAEDVIDVQRGDRPLDRTDVFFERAASTASSSQPPSVAT